MEPRRWMTAHTSWSFVWTLSYTELFRQRIQDSKYGLSQVSAYMALGSLRKRSLRDKRYGDSKAGTNDLSA